MFAFAQDDTSHDVLGAVVSWASHNRGIDHVGVLIDDRLDFCTYYGQSARFLEEAHSEFHPHTVTVVTPPWNFPIAIPTTKPVA